MISIIVTLTLPDTDTGTCTLINAGGIDYDDTAITDASDVDISVITVSATF